MKKQAQKEEFYGATTISEKGQVVIPCDARTDMKLVGGDKLLAFGIDGFLVLAKLSQLEKFEKHLAAKLSSFRNKR